VAPLGEIQNSRGVTTSLSVARAALLVDVAAFGMQTSAAFLKFITRTQVSNQVVRNKCLVVRRDDAMGQPLLMTWGPAQNRYVEAFAGRG
jgi:hypothetical protein